MLDTSALAFQRSRGEARVRLVAAGGRTMLAGLRQAGCAKAFLPRVHADRPEVVFLNTAGGLTGAAMVASGASLGETEGEDLRFSRLRVDSSAVVVLSRSSTTVWRSCSVPL